MHDRDSGGGPVPGGDATTVFELWQRAAREATHAPYLVEKGGRWCERGWEDVSRTVDELAAGFRSLGVDQGDRVALIARTRLEWALCDWALISIGAIVVPLYPTSSEVECAYVLGNSGADVVICEEVQRTRLASVLHDMDVLREIVVIDDTRDGDVRSLEAVRSAGRDRLAHSPAALAEMRSRVGSDDALTIMYTSGTTGPPKG